MEPVPEPESPRRGIGFTADHKGSLAPDTRADDCATIEFSMKVALGQINTTVGDLAGNVTRMVSSAREAARGGAELVVFPELSITGYPPRDLVEKPTFIERSEQHLERLAAETADLGLAVICGYGGRAHSSAGKGATNSPALLQKDPIVFPQSKI